MHRTFVACGLTALTLFSGVLAPSQGFAINLNKPGDEIVTPVMNSDGTVNAPKTFNRILWTLAATAAITSIQALISLKAPARCSTDANIVQELSQETNSWSLEFQGNVFNFIQGKFKAFLIRNNKDGSCTRLTLNDDSLFVPYLPFLNQNGTLPQQFILKDPTRNAIAHVVLRPQTPMPQQSMDSLV